MGTPRRSEEGEGSSGSSPLPLSRRVAAEDCGLQRRVQWARQHHAQVAHDVEFVDADRRRLGRRSHAVCARSGWKWKQDKKSFALYSRLRSTPETTEGSPLSASMSLPTADNQQTTSWTREWLAVGQVASSVYDMAKLLSPSSESDFNSVMKGLYRSSFIYGSVVHSAKTKWQQRDDYEGEDLPPPSPLLVKTCSFVRAHLFSRRNDQLCFVEQLAPTPQGGFTVAVYSLPAQELTAGTASSEMVREVHPFSAFWSVEPVSTRSSGASAAVRVLYHVCLYSSEPVPSNQQSENADSNSRHSITRMLLLVKGVAARLESLLVAGKRRVRLGTDPPASLSIGGGSAATSTAAALPAGHHNTYCIVCTRHLFGLFQSTPWRRCELCAYHVCEGCCLLQRLPTRELLHVCLRCTDSREFREYSSTLRDTPRCHTILACASDMDSSRGSAATGEMNGLVLKDPDESDGAALEYRSRVSSDQPGEFSL